jgi:hypothetical protein
MVAFLTANANKPPSPVGPAAEAAAAAAAQLSRAQLENLSATKLVSALRRFVAKSTARKEARRLAEERAQAEEARRLAEERAQAEEAFWLVEEVRAFAAKGVVVPTAPALKISPPPRLEGRDKNGEGPILCACFLS